jgi:hypothetical protein
MVYAFVKEPADIEVIKNSNAYKLHERLTEVGSFENLTKEERTNFNGFSELWNPDAYKTGRVKTGGWIIDFSAWMKKYWVKDKYYGIVEVRAFNKTQIRKNSCTPSYILQIVEVK